MATNPLTNGAFGAPRGVLIVDGNKPFLFATGITVSENQTNVPVKVLGDIYTKQFVPVDISVSLQVECVTLLEMSEVEMGIYKQGPTSADIILPDEMIFELYDNLTNKVKWRAYGCVCAHRTLPLGRGGIAAVSARFDARRLEHVGDEG